MTSDLNNTVVNFKTSALDEMRPAWQDVQQAADSFANSSVDVAAQAGNVIVHFGNETWSSLQAAAGPALAPVSAHVEVSLLSGHRNMSLVRLCSTCCQKKSVRKSIFRY